MIGYNVDWSSFFIIEVMSQTKFTHKRIGYLAAAQIFSSDTARSSAFASLICSKSIKVPG